MNGRVGVLGTVVAVLACAGTAEAKVVRAEAVLPPGQSGFVSLAGVTSGTGSPHLTDQSQLFIDFRRKPFGLDGPAATTEVPRAGVKVQRDAYGVPAVYGENAYDGWWGAGYAVAQDRLFQLEAFRHATQGRLADLTGKGALEDDLIARRDYYTAAERQQMFEALSPDLQQRIIAYRDGVNAWIDHVNANPQDLPGEYPFTGTALTPWTVQDTLSIGVFLARTIPSSDGAELLNLRAVQQSGSPGVLDALVPLRIKGQRPTIPPSEGSFPQGKRLTSKKARAARKRSLAFADTLPKASERAARAATRKGALLPGRIGRTGGSYMFAVRKPEGGAILFNGPQLGYSIPELFVELEVHYPGLDVRGGTAPGVPLIGTGHNGNVAWGITSGLSDDDDLYAEKLVPGEPEKYYFKGEVREMECRTERLTWSGPPSDLVSGTVPDAGSRTERVCRTVHGPVQLRQGNVAYARKYAIWKRELETLSGLAQINAAKTIQDVDRATADLTWNENLMAADSAGNIGYWHPGLLQQRPSTYDQRLPLPGTGEAEWGGLVPRSKLPRVINPKQGWLANWNNIPSDGWTTGDGEASERQTGRLHRVGWLARHVANLAKAPSFAAAEEAVRKAGSYAQQRQLAAPQVRRLARGTSGPAKAVFDAILAWDGDYVRTDAAGTIDPGVSAWQEWKKAIARRVDDRLGKGATLFPDRPGASHVYDMTAKQAYGLRELPVAALREAAADAHGVLAKQFGTDDVARWRAPRAMYDVGAQGAGSAPDLPFFDRGTMEMLTELAP